MPQFPQHMLACRQPVLSILHVPWLPVIECCLQVLRSKHQQHLAACSQPKRPEGSHFRRTGHVTIEGMTEKVSCPVFRCRAMITSCSTR